MLHAANTVTARYTAPGLSPFVVLFSSSIAMSHQ